MSGKIKEIPEMWPRSKESISFILRQFEGLDKWLLDQVMFFFKIFNYNDSRKQS